MKKTLQFILLAGASTFFAACGAPAANSGAIMQTQIRVTDGFASALSPTVEMLTRKGTADGTCGGQKVGGTVIWGVSIYVKDGDAWKFAFGMNSPLCRLDCC
jgi:hypothetical protein